MNVLPFQIIFVLEKGGAMNICKICLKLKHTEILQSFQEEKFAQ